MSFILSKIQGNKGNHPRLTKEISMNEFSSVYAHFRHMFQKQLNEPCADNNSLINYDLKCRDFLMMNGTFFMLMSGAGTMSLKKIAGAPIDTMCLNYLGNKKGYVL